MDNEKRILTPLEQMLVDRGFKEKFGFGLFVKHNHSILADTNTGNVCFRSNINGSNDDILGFADDIQELDVLLKKFNLNDFMYKYESFETEYVIYPKNSTIPIAPFTIPDLSFLEKQYNGNIVAHGVQSTTLPVFRKDPSMFLPEGFQVKKLSELKELSGGRILEWDESRRNKEEPIFPEGFQDLPLREKGVAIGKVAAWYSETPKFDQFLNLAITDAAFLAQSNEGIEPSVSLSILLPEIAKSFTYMAEKYNNIISGKPIEPNVQLKYWLSKASDYTVQPTRVEILAKLLKDNTLPKEQKLSAISNMSAELNFKQSIKEFSTVFNEHTTIDEMHDISQDIELAHKQLVKTYSEEPTIDSPKNI